MKHKKITLSLVIPVFNEEGYIRTCLNAIAVQSVLPDEVIVVDNNSTDKTAYIAREYPFVKVLKENRQGIVYARNKGFNAASGQLIGRIDADTHLPKDWVKNVKRLYIESGKPTYYAATAPSIFRNRGHRVFYALHRISYFWPGRLLLGHTVFVGSNMFITKALWSKVINKVCLKTDIHEDMDLAVHINQMNVMINFHPEIKSSIVARRMLSRSILYPRMMVRTRTVHHDLSL